MSETHPTFSGAEEQQKTVTLLWVVQLTPRRALIAAAAVVGFYTLCTYAAPALGMEGGLWMWLAPFVALALVVAFFRPGGHYLEWWIPRKIANLLRPSVLLYRPRDEENPLRRVRDSVRDALPVEDIEWQWIKTEEGTRIVVFRVEPYAVSLASEAEIGKLWEAARDFYRRLDFPVVEVELRKRGTTERYARRVYARASAEIEATSGEESRQKLLEYANAHLSFAAEVPTDYHIRDLSTYLLIPYHPGEEHQNSAGSPFSAYDPRALLSAVSGKPTAYETVKDQAHDEAAFAEISARAGMV